MFQVSVVSTEGSRIAVLYVLSNSSANIAKEFFLQGV